MSHPNPLEDYRDDEARWQKEDLDQEYMRRVELVQKAQRNSVNEGCWFTDEDVEDLKFFLRVGDWFRKEKA